MRYIAATLLILGLAMGSFQSKPTPVDGYQFATYEQKSDEAFEGLVKSLKKFT